MTAALAPLLVVLLVVGSALWVLLDATRRARAGSPVVLRVGQLTVDTPLVWFAGCLVLWVVVLPLYLAGRSHP